MKTETYFTFRVDVWDSAANSIIEQIAGIDDFKVAVAAYWAAVGCAVARRMNTDRILKIRTAPVFEPLLVPPRRGVKPLGHCRATRERAKTGPLPPQTEALSLLTIVSTYIRPSR